MNQKPNFLLERENYVEEQIYSAKPNALKPNYIWKRGLLSGFNLLKAMTKCSVKNCASKVFF